MNENKLLSKINLIPSQDIRNFVISKYHVGIAIRTINTMKSKNDANYFFNHLAKIINNKLFEAINYSLMSANYENDLTNNFTIQKNFKVDCNIVLKDFIEYFNIKED